MIKHISVFTLKNKEEINGFVEMLDEVAKCPLIVHSEVGVNVTPKPEEGLEGPEFGDVVQIISFNSKEDLDAYPSSKEHMKLFKEGPVMEKVSAIDYEVKD